MNRGIGVTETLRETLPEWTVPVFELLSLPGDLLVIVPLLGLLYLRDVIGSLGHTVVTGEDGSLCSDRTAFLIATVFGGLALVVLLKAVFSAPRPPAPLHATAPSEYGFPSGHTMAATITWGAIGLWTTVGHRYSRYGVAALFVSIVALSRLALGVHYLADVLASVVFGVTFLAVFARITDERPSRAFVVAVGIAVLAALVSDGSGRSLLALAGTASAGIGWWVLERPPIRRRLVRTVREQQSY